MHLCNAATITSSGMPANRNGFRNANLTTTKLQLTAVVPRSQRSVTDHLAKHIGTIEDDAYFGATPAFVSSFVLAHDFGGEIDVAFIPWKYQ
ncbi:hypothetical protein DVH05_001223 [Phytophthora capsici]|nr:hypothetical protein DVH05_001223 [Phytophthora capsici]